MTNLNLKFFPQKCLFCCKLKVYKFGNFLSTYKRKLVFFPNFSLVSLFYQPEQVFPCLQIFNANFITIEKTNKLIQFTHHLLLGKTHTSQTIHKSICNQVKGYYIYQFLEVFPGYSSSKYFFLFYKLQLWSSPQYRVDMRPNQWKKQGTFSVQSDKLI